MDETVRTYDSDAAAYVAGTATMTDAVRARVDALADPLLPDLSLPEGPYDAVWANASQLRGESWLEVSAVRDSVSP